MDLLQIFATLVIGLFAGSLLTEGVVLVPYWRRMVPVEFFRLHGDVGPSLFRYFVPLTTGAVVLAVIAALVHGELYAWRTATALLCLAALMTFMIYFRKANASFADHSLELDQLGAELARWSAWHWLRTILVIAAFTASLMAYA